MRKIVLMLSVSLDGYFEGPNGELDWQLVDDELHEHFNEVLGAMRGFLSGRVTYELMAGFWPTADEDPTSTKPMVEFARIWRDMPKIVFSRTLRRADWNTEVRHEVDPVVRIARVDEDLLVLLVPVLDGVPVEGHAIGDGRGLRQRLRIAPDLVLGDLATEQQKENVRLQHEVEVLERQLSGRRAGGGRGDE